MKQTKVRGSSAYVRGFIRGWKEYKHGAKRVTIGRKVLTRKHRK